MGRRSKDGNAVTHVDRTNDVTYHTFKGATCVRGATLERFWHDPKRSEGLEPNMHFFWVYTPTPDLVAIQCDGCVTQHKPSNTTQCTAFFPGRLSPMVDPSVLYWFKTKEPIKLRFTLEEVVHGPSVSGWLVRFDGPFVPQ